MRDRIKKVAAVHDLSGVGRCALTVAIPVLSAMKVQVCPVPTVVLSTHMGGFGMPASVDLTHGLNGYLEHWKACDLTFDCLYSGYLANEEQIHMVTKLFTEFRQENTLVVVDPVMGDNGKLYGAFGEKMQACMRQLIGYADVITPNLTEAYFLINEPYQDIPHTDEAIGHLLEKLAHMTHKQIVVKGIQDHTGQRVNIAYDKAEGICHKIPYDEIPTSYPGTGDTFCSVMIGKLLEGDSLKEAVEGAATFVKEAVAYTYEAGTPNREGILIEGLLHQLM